MTDRDDREFDAFVAENRETLFLVALKECRGCPDPREEALERIQDALVKVWKNWEKAKSQNPIAYTVTAVKNECRSAYRRVNAAKRAPETLTDPHDHSWLDRTSGDETDERVKRIDLWSRLKVHLSRLKPADREILFRRHYLDQSIRQVAEDMALPEGTVKWSTSVTVEQLRTMFIEEEGRG